MQQSASSEANRFSASKEIPRILCNPKVHNRIHKCPRPVPILSQINPVHAPTFKILKFHLKIIFPFAPDCPKSPLSIRVPHQNDVFASPVSHTRYMSLQSRSSRFFDRTNLLEKYRSLSFSLCRFSTPLYLLPLNPNIPLIILFSDKLIVRFSLNVTDQFSHPLKITGKITVLNILLFIFNKIYLPNNNLLQDNSFGRLSRWLPQTKAFLCGLNFYNFFPNLQNKYL